MTATLLTPEAKEALRKAVRGLRVSLLDELTRTAKGDYQLDVALDRARLTEAMRARRERLESWLAEQARAAGAKAGSKAELRTRFIGQAIEEAAHTLLNRLVFVRILEHHQLLGEHAPRVVTGGWKSVGYAAEFLEYAGPLADDDSRGYRHLLDAIFAELALELPGLFGNVGLTALFPIPAHTLRTVIEVLDDPVLATAWGDDTTLGWVYQYWNDPQREELDKKIAGGGKIEPHEIASKTQMFTERYMVEWLLQNSVGFTWLAICKKNGWTADAEGVLPELDARRTAWRTQREAGAVALDALMPIAPGLESDWKYYVPQPVPDDAVEKAPGSIADLKLLDPACGSGHFLVIAFGLLARMYEEEARHRGASWSAAEIAQRIVADNLHGIDIDARAIQIAAASLWLRAKQHAPHARLSRMNLVAPSFRLAALPKDDPARVALETELANLGVPRATTARLIDALKGVDHLGTLLRVDREIGALLDQAERDEPLFAQGARKQRARLEEFVASFLDAHAAESDLGLRLEGEQLAAGVRFIELAKEGRYNVVVGNPPYQGLSKTKDFEYVVRNYPRGKADLYAAFLDRGLELVRDGGFSCLVTIRGWMFLGQFADLRRALLREHRLLLGDIGWGAFEIMTDNPVTMSIAQRSVTSSRSGAISPTDPTARVRTDEHRRSLAAGLLTQVGRYEFDPRAFAVIDGEPIVYWWSKQALEEYAQARKLGRVSPARVGMKTSNNARFVRRPFEISPNKIRAQLVRDDPVRGGGSGWVPYVQGAAGKEWCEPLDEVVDWRLNGLAIKVTLEQAYGMPPQAERWYFKGGVAFSPIGAKFSARAHRYRSIFSTTGTSLFPADPESVVCLMNATSSRAVLQSLNPGTHFEVRDANRLPMRPMPLSTNIMGLVYRAFEHHESCRETSVEFIRPASSAWRSAQHWAQLAVDRPEGAALPAYEPKPDPPDGKAPLSFAIGVALGRFGAAGEGIFSAAPKTAVPEGIIFVGPSDAYADSLTHAGVAPVLAAYDIFTSDGKKPPLRDWLRRDFFAYHKALYENRPIYFPLSSEKKSFVAWVSIHRFTDATLSTLLADHLHPVLRQIDAEIRDANTARASSDKKAAIAAGKAYDAAKRLRDELADFIASVTQCAERGAPPTDASCSRREVDAMFSMDLDDGVMINSAALWSLLAPQWNDPKKWWKQLCLAEGKKDYDWAHLAKRYFPTRVDEKCKKDPSLAVAHGCFWRYHPAKAYAWELRLEDEIRPDFTIDEVGSTEARAAYLVEHAAEAETAREKERARRQRKAAKQEDESDEAPEPDDAEGDDE